MGSLIGLAVHGDADAYRQFALWQAAAASLCVPLFLLGYRGATPIRTLPLSLPLSLSLPLTRWALRGNFWFDRIKATETPLRVVDELIAAP